MTSIKPNLTEQQVRNLLEDNFTTQINDLRPISEGQISQTFSFKVASQPEYIVRFSDTSINLLKEAFIYQHFALGAFPMPPVIATGLFEGLNYTITGKVAGKTLDNLTPGEYQSLAPKMVETLAAIHRVSIAGTKGYGNFKEDGTGEFTSWREFINFVGQEEPDGYFYGKWHNLFETTFLERAFFNKVYSFMQENLAVCPEDRYLVHAGYGYGNVLAHDGEITGVIDWVEARYGDFLYDIAWLDFWQDKVDFGALFREYYQRQNISVPNFVERINCYNCYIGLDSLRFFAKVGDQNGYSFTRQKLIGAFPELS